MSEKIIDEYIPQELAADGREAGVEKDEFKPFPFDSEKISISDKRVPLQTLIRRLEQGTISAPAIQRGAGLWDDDQQSRLIESLMLKIPVPLFYVAEDEDSSWKVVDGLQRVTAIDRYVLRKEFKLSGLEFLDELEGKEFDRLPQKFQNRILETELQFAIINPSTPQNVQRNVFKRLNTGGLPLTAQEIRHALYYGPSANLLKELAQSKNFKKATTESVNDSRMAARELILRFFAFLIRGVDFYPKNEDMDDFLSGTMQLINFMPDLLPGDIKKVLGDDVSNVQIRYQTHDQLKDKFNTAMNRAALLFGEYAFRKSPPDHNLDRTPINKSLFEAWAVLLSEMTDDDFAVVINNKKRFYSLLHAVTYSSPNDDLSRYISRDSHKSQGVKKRYGVLRSILKISISEKDLKDSIEILNKTKALEDAFHLILENDNLREVTNKIESSHD